MDDLTKEQQRLLVSMYKEMLSRQPALSLKDARKFEDSNTVRNLFCPDKSSDDVADLCWALHSNGYLKCEPGDDLANDICITDKTIIHMENRFKNGLKEIVSFLSSLIP